jgi:hypothetical protein
MNSHAFKHYFRRSSSHYANGSKNKVHSLRVAAVAFASALAILASGCARLPDKTIVAESMSTESGYPNVPIKRATAPARRGGKVLPVKQVSSSYLGRAQYICTPSGFGRTSGCFLRKS